MKQYLTKLLSFALVVVLMLSLSCTALAAIVDANDGVDGDFEQQEAPVYSGNVITFKDGTSYELTAKPGTTKRSNGDVDVSGVSGIMPEKYIPEADGADQYYNFSHWAIKNKDGELERIDLKTYKFTGNETVYAVMNDTWPPYKDMAQDRSDWFYTYVRDLSVAGVVNGYPGYTFAPQGKVTWGEALKLIMLAAGYDEQAPTADHWASGYLSKAEADALVETGAVTNLNLPITRLEYAQVASKALGLKNVSIKTPFADTEAQEVLNLYDVGIMEGSFDDAGNRLFKPNDYITRAEISTVIWRINQYYLGK